MSVTGRTSGANERRLKLKWFIKKEDDGLLYLYELPAKGDPTKAVMQHVSSIRCVDDNSSNCSLIRVYNQCYILLYYLFLDSIVIFRWNSLIHHRSRCLGQSIKAVILIRFRRIVKAPNRSCHQLLCFAYRKVSNAYQLFFKQRRLLRDNLVMWLN